MFRKLIKLFSHKALIAFISLLLQAAIVVVAVSFAATRWQWIWLVQYVLSIAVCLYIVSRDMNPSYKLSWCILILLVPVFGGSMYLFIGRQHTPRRVRKRLREASDASQILLNTINAHIASERGELNPTGTPCAELVLNSASYPVYSNTATEYFPLGDDFFPRMLDDIRAARKFILMEYFIIERGAVWNELEAALIERAEHGVDVKIIYDDVGCMFTLPKKTIENLRAHGIRILPFNRVTASFDVRLNNRTHRKITVIDGAVAYTGGNNIADEYANKKVRFGHWKDTHMRFEGDAVCSFTAMFLAFWHILSDEPIYYENYFIQNVSPPPRNGYVQPLSCGPGRNDNLIESAFINLISTAEKSLYITTPYLILDNETVTALRNAAKAGVDVRIVIPAVPDKKLVYKSTKSFAEQLIKSGIKIYTYTPGFIHAKMMIVDGKRAFIGTCNMDYRSFYLHYECGALLYGTDSIADMTADFDGIIAASHRVTDEEISDVTLLTVLARSIMRLFAPLM